MGDCAGVRPPYQQRVIDEAAELEAKLARLAAFMGTPVYNALPADERSRLNRQQSAMTDYLAVLNERIDAFTPRSSA